MRITYFLQDIHFEWDRRKASQNLIKHAIPFRIAAECFFDPFLKYLDDEMHDDEVREKFIGMTKNSHLLIVVYTIREDDIFRIISARPATKRERKTYERQ